MAAIADDSLTLTDNLDGPYPKTSIDTTEIVEKQTCSDEDLDAFFSWCLSAHRDARKRFGTLHLGSANCLVQARLRGQQCSAQICVDAGSVVVTAMKRVTKELDLENPLHWQQIRATDIEFVPDGSVDLVFDSGTLDAMTQGSPWNPIQESLTSIGYYLSHISRLLSRDGVFLCFTDREPFFVRALIKHGATRWRIETEPVEGHGFSALICRPVFRGV